MYNMDKSNAGYNSLDKNINVKNADANNASFLERLLKNDSVKYVVLPVTLAAYLATQGCATVSKDYEFNAQNNPTPYSEKAKDENKFSKWVKEHPYVATFLGILGVVGIAAVASGSKGGGTSQTNGGGTGGQ